MEPWQAILISAAVSAAAVFTTYCLGRRERKTERGTEHAEWVGEVNADRAWLKRAVASIQETVSDIDQQLRRQVRVISPQQCHQHDPSGDDGVNGDGPFQSVRRLVLERMRRRSGTG